MKKYLTTTLKVLIISALNLFLLQTAFANNVVVSHISLTGQDAANDYTFVQFDISWENSWRDAGNWDASWVFIKYSTDGGTTWNHATLATTGHTAPAGSTIDTPADGKGVFIYRNTVSSGTNTWNGVQLKWQYGTDIVSDDAIVLVKVFAIEMVYIPQASFYVGSGGSEDGHFFEGGGNNPFQITSEAEITVGNAAGQLYYSSGGDQTGPIPDAFPKGYNAFYMMKYEITQEQYKDFLNCLTRQQQDRRTASDPLGWAMGEAALSNRNDNRNGIDCLDPGFSLTIPAVFACNLEDDGYFNNPDDGQNIACNYLSWIDGAAYADWAGLRPMTELEFEKACRGNQTPVANEYAWGTANIALQPYTLINSGAANEDIAENYAQHADVGNASHDETNRIDGPLRVGIFAGNVWNTTNQRVRSGAGFYGNMELSGNVLERAVTIGNATGRGFTGTLGDGSLTAFGEATNSDWPFLSNTGWCNRGGDWDHSDMVRVSDRDLNVGGARLRSPSFGFRCVRPAP